MINIIHVIISSPPHRRLRKSPIKPASIASSLSAAQAAQKSGDFTQPVEKQLSAAQAAQKQSIWLYSLVLNALRRTGGSEINPNRSHHAAIALRRTGGSERCPCGVRVDAPALRRTGGSENTGKMVINKQCALRRTGGSETPTL